MGAITIQHSDAKLRQRKIHWAAPVLIIASLLVGVVFAVGHHCLNHALAGTVVSSHSQQQWLIRAGTALALLFKTSLIVGTGTAYIQQLWLTFGRHAWQIGQIDNMFGVLKDLTCFFDIGVWARNPLLTLMAIITWAIPISAVITPGTLTVQLEGYHSMNNLTVPSLNMDETIFYSYIAADIGTQPVSKVTRVALSSLLLGSVVPMQPHYPNSSYTTHFYAPALECTPWSTEALQQFKNQSCPYFYSQSCEGSYEDPLTARQDHDTLRYLSWSDRFTADDPAENYNATNPPLEAATRGGTRFPVGVITGTLHFFVGQDDYYVTGQPGDPGPDLLTTCHLQNASYDMRFTFVNDGQVADVVSQEIVALTMDPATDFGGTDQTYIERSYAAMWLAFSELLTGFMTYPNGTNEGQPSTIANTQISNSALDPLTNGYPSADIFSRGLEQLFRNMTISYLSVPELTTDTTTSPIALIDYTLYQNVYSYQVTALWRAYAAAIGVALICALIGFRALALNGASFQNLWSTIFRTTRAPEFQSLFSDDDHHYLEGSQPVPKSIDSTVVLYMADGFHLRVPNGPVELVDAPAQDVANEGSHQPSYIAESGADNVDEHQDRYQKLPNTEEPTQTEHDAQNPLVTGREQASVGYKYGRTTDGIPYAIPRKPLARSHVNTSYSPIDTS